MSPRATPPNEVKPIPKTAFGRELSRTKLGVIGLGAVGSALAHVLRWFYDDVRGYDIVGTYDWGPILATDAAFICVSTPGGRGGRLDCSQVTAVLNRLAKGNYKGIAVIRSTVGVGYLSQAQNSFPNLRLVYSPEFLRERSRFQWSANPDRLVVSGAPADIETVVEIFSWMEDATILRMSHREAEVGKLAHNAFIATKVSFTNTIASICRNVGANPEEVMSVVWSDRRVRNRAHLEPSGGPYGGKCVPKDTRELVVAGGFPELLVSVERVNQSVQKRDGAADSLAPNSPLRRRRRGLVRVKKK